jgi:hypothetical protein
MNSLKTASEIIDALGGTFAFARATNSNPKTVSNWRKNGFPSARFPDLEPLLRSQGIKADTSAFSFRRPQEPVPWAE